MLQGLIGTGQPCENEMFSGVVAGGGKTVFVSSCFGLQYPIAPSRGEELKQLYVQDVRGLRITSQPSLI